ncbi:YbaB/EbfC family nucleoid-associated protein [Saccharopolyspora gregorii]|uniref:YbaB/EbfC family DNA-binding protein n=1 Tax=Saccharopolyspora gregorii TaxID=33914 RepID=A0ABP6RMF2_9PSEU|nr:YbaB/EbfC family nucleoid-associated protein [Saccharopolyspora gregorii]
MQEIEDLVAEIGRRTEEVAEVGRSLSERRISVDVPGGIGTVSVSGHGQLIDIELDRENLWRTNESSLGRLVVDALADAERQAAELRERDFQNGQG